MASGTIHFTQSKTSGTYIDGKIEWTSTADKGANNSDVTAQIYVRKADTTQTLTIPTTGTWKYKITIGGSSFSGSVYKAVLEDWILLATKTINDIDHDGNGTKSVTISGTVTAPTGTSLEGHSTSGSGTATFDTIPRASTIASADDIMFGSACNIKWTPASASFRYKLRFSIGTWVHETEAIHPNKTSLFTYDKYVIPLDAASQIPNSLRGTISVSLYTYSDSSATAQVGSYDTEVFTATVPDNADTKPYASEMVLSPVHSLGSTFAGLYIQGYSKVKVTSTAVGKYGATVTWKSVTVEGKDYGSSSDYTSDYLSGYGTVYVKLTLQDSRGFTNTKTLSITVIPYSMPRVLPVNGEANVACGRCDASGNWSDSGTYLKIKAARGYSLCLADGVQKNYCGIRYRYKLSSDSDYSAWVNLLNNNNLSTDEVITAPLLNGTLLTGESYVVQVDAVDSIPNHTSLTFTIPTEKVYMHKAGNIRSLAIGEYATDSNTLSIASDIAVKVKNSINGVFMGTKVVSGVSTFDIQTKYADFTASGNGNERQTLFIFGAANASLVYGLARVSNSGVTAWSGTTGVTLSTKAGGILTVTLPATAYDLFTIISSRKFTV